jgi:hypothetical protein
MKRTKRSLALSRETLRPLASLAIAGAKGKQASILQCSVPATTCTSCPSYGPDSNCCLATTQRFC